MADDKELSDKVLNIEKKNIKDQIHKQDNMNI
jgi:hypothetical protein